jgi:glycosyltransferase involved in cell wall biosynthesis
MENNPLISVVTVSYNAVSTIEQTILSVINQTYPNIEYVIIDGESTDGTVDVIKKYADRITYWVSEPDKGIYDAMNKGMGISTGDFLIFIGADDLFYTTDVIKNIVAKIKEMNVIYYGNVIFKGVGKKYLGKFNKIKWATTNISHQAIFYPRQVYIKYVYNTQYRVYADYAKSCLNVINVFIPVWDSLILIPQFFKFVGHKLIKQIIADSDKMTIVRKHSI